MTSQFTFTSTEKESIGKRCKNVTFSIPYHVIIEIILPYCELSLTHDVVGQSVLQHNALIAIIHRKEKKYFLINNYLVQ